MAATFEVEDGSGKSDANSYLSVADADQYFEDHGDPAGWTGIDSVKEAALRMATQYLDAVYGSYWRGTKYDTDQALEWPRTGARDDNGHTYDYDDLPVKLEHATAEAALRHITETNGLLPDVSKPGDIKSESKKMSIMSKSVTYVTGYSQIKQFRIIDLIVNQLVESANYVQRG